MLLSTLRRCLPTLLLLGGASALLLLTDRARSARALPAVAVLQQTSSTVLDDAVTGMLAGLAERGFKEGETVTVRRFNAQGDMAQGNAIAHEIVEGPFDLVLTSSTPSLQQIANANPRIRMRHVFAAVADPFSAGVGLDRADPMSHPAWLVGYGSLAPVDFTFGIAKRLNPGLKRVGVAHNNAESNSRRFMDLARVSCRNRGIELFEVPVENSSGVIEAVQSTISRGAEAIFCPGDTTVISAIDSVIATASKAGIPVFTVNPGKPDRGTLFDVGFNFLEVGLVAGRLAGDILAGTDPATVPIRETAGEIPPYLSLNRVAKGIDRTVWRIPEDLASQARWITDDEGARENPGAVLEGPFDEPADGTEAPPGAPSAAVTKEATAEPPSR
jgi:putative ABC transport system substrate-binding protein